MQVRKQQLGQDMEQQTGSKLEKEYIKVVYCHPAYLTYMQSTSFKCWARGGTSWNQDCQEKYKKPEICRWYHPYGRKRRTKDPLYERERGKWKCWLKVQHSENKDHGIQSHNFMETVRDFNFLGSKITADGDCSQEIKRCLLFGRKAMTNPDSILKSRDITLPTKVHLVKAIFFPVVMYGCEYWTIKKAEHQGFDAFELRCWRRLLRVPWTAWRSNQSILKEISPEYSLEGLMLKVKLQYLATWCQELLIGKDPDSGKDWRWEEKGITEDEMVGWHHRLSGHEFE